MKKISGIISGLILLAPASQAAVPESLLTDSHDITTLHTWGPYSKRYAGISHIPDMDAGVRFDFSVMPGYYRNRQLVPHVLFESSYYPWDISADMRRITYRYEMEWKDRVYTDVTYLVLDSCHTLVRMDCVNNTSLPQNLVLNLMAYVDYEDNQPLVEARPESSARWIDATHYSANEPAVRTPQYALVYDGACRNGRRTPDATGGFALSGIADHAGHRLEYDVDLPRGLDHGVVAVRYEVPEGCEAVFALGGTLASDTLRLRGGEGFRVASVPFAGADGGSHKLILTAVETAPCTLDGLFVGADEDAVVFAERKVGFTPELIKGDGGRDFVVRYPVAPDYYGVAWNFPQSEIREILDDNLESFFRKKTHDHVSARLTGNGKWHYTDAFLRPVVIAPESSETVYALLATGSRSSVERDMALFHSDPGVFIGMAPGTDAATEVLPEGQRYATGIRLMQAALLSNIVYPVHTCGQYIRHFTPGKNWNSLYTWDSGFIAIGLSDVDSDKAFECLRAYTTSPGSESAFVHHGTPLPIQIFAMQEIRNRNPSDSVLRFIYPRLRQFYDFMAGNNPHSTTLMKKSGLLRTWDYFYNSGGWDDYPPQKARTDKASVVPVVSTAYYIRAARILRAFASRLGLKGDVKAYDAFIAKASAALERYAWDDASGYYGYVMHDADGRPGGILRYSDGSNFNMGLDGVSPLVAGIAAPARRDSMINRIFDPSRLWTPSGISTVDMSAPYYRSDGYWNGAVWFPHQWLLWKSMLDEGLPDRAWQIASTALEAWERECAESYFTFEHFIIASGRGAGWHQFSGLSSPILSWFASYYRPGKISTGFETFVDEGGFSSDLRQFDGAISFDDAAAPRSRTVLVCLKPSDSGYKATFRGREVAMTERHPGLLEITLPATNRPGRLVVK